MSAEAMQLLAGLPLPDGRPWGSVATDWQRATAAAVLDRSGPPSHWDGRPRGGSKTLDAAGIAVVAHLTQAPPGATSYMVAADADQGGLLLDSVRGFVLRRPELRGWLRVEARRVVFVRQGQTLSTLAVVAADEASAYGLRPWLLVADELAQWPSTANARGLWAAMISALPKVPGSRLLVLTAAGAPNHWSFKVLEHARTSDRWRVSNVPGPLPWVAEAALAEQRALLTESQYARLHLNVWTAAEDRLTTPDQVRACVGHSGPLEPAPGVEYVLGLDVGLTNDRTVLTAEHLENRGGRGVVVVDRQWVWQGSKDRPVPLGDVEAVTFEASRRYGRAALVADPYQAVHLCQRLRSRGVTVREFTFSSGSVGRLALTLYRLLREAGLDLDGDDVALLDELARVRLVETAPGAYRIDHASGDHDDRVISLALAAHALVERGTLSRATIGPPRGSLPRVPIDRRSPKTGTRKVGPFLVPLAGYRPPERWGRW